jgi:hypothetical protein
VRGVGRPLRVIDQETARVVAIHREDGRIVGSGCLLDSGSILTCRHVVKLAVEGLADPRSVLATLVGVTGTPTVESRVVSPAGHTGQQGGVFGPEDDLALLSIEQGPRLAVPAVEFASPMRHGGKGYSVLGFPGGDPQGRNASGHLQAMDALGLVQMDRGSSLLVRGGFSGAPVWCPDLGAFVGIVVTELADAGVAWCIPSRRLCQFHPELLVRFRVPPADRPQIHDFELDDPNVQLFGSTSDNGERRLTATVREAGDDDPEDEDYVATARYECLPGSRPPRGGYVTFITHPSYSDDDQDAYELFARLEDGRAEVEFYPEESFTVAAVGDAGDTALTVDLKTVDGKPASFQ